ncbi:DUF3054 domain-containing protein [Staphylococcus chromogenes]|nr:DUF3054 domain-containing protein [Staphylococcus chromogenes]
MNIRFFLYDITAIILFATFARLAHQTPDMPFGIRGIAETGWPFLIGILAAWAFFALRRTTLPASFTSGAVTWVCAVFAGLGTWAVRHGEIPHWSFIIVASVMSALLLFGWRLIHRVVFRRSVAS